MSNPEPFTVRTMTRAELDLALGWAAAEGWNPGLHDADPFHAADPSGFFVGLLGGEPAGCIASVAHDGSFGFLGLYIVRPEFRGRGLGLRLWQAGLDYLGKRTVGLDAVLAQQENYARWGFRPAYRVTRYRGAGGGARPAGVVDLAGVPLDEVLAYDREVFPAPRREFLRRWLRPPYGAALGLVRGGRLAGYGVIRACHQGFAVGPLCADDEAGAEALFEALAGHAAGVDVFLDVPAANPAAVALARRRGMNTVFETVRMYRGGPPPRPLHRLFAAATAELG
jgi:ribosomal protein S18 acetylase RimI-like enzyme